MGILQTSSQSLAKQLDEAAAGLDALRAKAADASDAELQRIGAAIAGLQAKKEHLEARYADAVKAERDKETEAQRKRLEREHAAAIAAWRQARADLAGRWAAWFAEMQATEARLLDMWRDFETMQGEQTILHHRGAPLGLEVGELTAGTGAKELFYRMDRRMTPLRRWTGNTPRD